MDPEDLSLEVHETLRVRRFPPDLADDPETPGWTGTVAGRTATAAGATPRKLEFWRPPPSDGQPVGRVSRRLHQGPVHRAALLTADLLAGGLATVLAVGPVGLKMLALLPLVPLLSTAVGLYDRDDLMLRASTLDEVPAILTVSTLYAVAVWLTDHVVLAPVTRGQFVALWLGLLLFMLIGRGIGRAIAQRVSEPERCLLLCAAPFEFDQLRKSLRLGREVAADAALGVALDAASIEFLVEGTLRELIVACKINRVIIAPGSVGSDSVLELVQETEAAGAKVSLLPKLEEVMVSAMSDQYPTGTMLAIRRFESGRSSRLLKRGFDLLAAGIMLVVLAPLFLVIAVAIRVTSPGPVVFRQTRVGRDGRTFQMLKFRSMVHNADALKRGLLALNEADGIFKIADDPRITPLGKRLRQTSLDELPQLVNVLRGDMSLVGPRPLPVEEDRRIEGWHRRRLNLPPGMTGHWQVLGSSRVPLSEMVVIDYLYVANWSLWEDVKTLLRTVPAVIGRRGM